jgi:hypothetical protein
MTFARHSPRFTILDARPSGCRLARSMFAGRVARGEQQSVAVAQRHAKVVGEPEHHFFGALGRVAGPATFPHAMSSGAAWLIGLGLAVAAGAQFLPRGEGATRRA